MLDFGAFCAFGYRGPDRVTAGVASVVEAVVWLATLLLALFGMAWTTVARSAWWCRVLVLLVVRRWTASATSYVSVLFPVVTMALEAWLMDEPVTGRAATGAALVMLGVWLGALSPGADAAPLPAQAPPPITEAHRPSCLPAAGQVTGSTARAPRCRAEGST
ncbi:MAG: hypothetical protein M3276_00655 [Actinomycetota bacterium]|nr:hypothetical protein [Actinomycetota bacterium]